MAGSQPHLWLLVRLCSHQLPWSKDRDFPAGSSLWLPWDEKELTQDFVPVLLEEVQLQGLVKGHKVSVVCDPPERHVVLENRRQAVRAWSHSFWDFISLILLLLQTSLQGAW